MAPLRNYKASSKVLECVAQLLSLPLVLGGPPKEIAEIRGVYVEVKLVPNLIYASKLLCNTRKDCVDSPSPTVCSSFKYNGLFAAGTVNKYLNFFTDN